MAPTGVAVRAARPLVVTIALAVVLLGISAGPAAAHERREVDRFTFTVGFLTEPAYAGIPNGVDLALSETESGEPFVELTDTLQVDVSYGDETTTMTMRPLFRVGVFGTPGDYGANFVPSRPGQYTFHLYGTVGDVEVNETFVSGPDTFDDVQSLTEASFPAQDPTTGELAERLEREIARLHEEVGSGHNDGAARVLGAGGLLLGLVAVGLVLVRRQP